MKITLSIEGETLTAEMVSCETTDQFPAMMPVTIRMHDFCKRIKYSYFDGPLSLNRVKQIGYEMGDIAYWPEGNELLLYYRHDGKPMRSDIIVLGRILSRSELLGECRGSVDITFTPQVPVK